MCPGRFVARGRHPPRSPGRSTRALRKASVEAPSDINGLIYIAFEGEVSEVKPTLFRVLDEAGYQPSRDGLA